MPEYGREDQFSLDRLINRTNTAEGTSLPPQQRGPFRVPYVSGVRVKSTEPNKYTVTWIEPEGNENSIAQYNVFVQTSNNPNSPTGIASVAKSPAEITLAAPTNARLTFFVQTQLGNGFVNPAESSPSASISAPAEIKTVSSAYTCGPFDSFVLVDTTSADVTVKLPPSPDTSQTIRFKKTVAANNMIIDGNGHNIDGAATLSVAVRYTAFILIFYNGEWRIV